MKVRWDALNNAALARIQELEDASARLGEFNDNVRDLKNVLNRCEDKLQATGDNKDPKILQVCHNSNAINNLTIAINVKLVNDKIK